MKLEKLISWPDTFDVAKLQVIAVGDGHLGPSNGSGEFGGAAIAREFLSGIIIVLARYRQYCAFNTEGPIHCSGLKKQTVSFGTSLLVSTTLWLCVPSRQSSVQGRSSAHRKQTPNRSTRPGRRPHGRQTELAAATLQDLHRAQPNGHTWLDRAREPIMQSGETEHYLDSLPPSCWLEIAWVSAGDDRSPSRVG